jgi:hypothetical protein
MKAIVVIFEKLPAGEPLAVLSSGNSEAVVILDPDKTNRADKSTTCNESTPPFWTWFIENPRPTLRDLSVVLPT